jgi:hypothetical protein
VCSAAHAPHRSRSGHAGPRPWLQPGEGADIDLFLRAARHLAVRQRAEIKPKTFPFMRYGTVGAAAVRTVTADSVSYEKRGVVFPVTLVMER